MSGDTVVGGIGQQRVDPTRVEHELAALWRPNADRDEIRTTRACMSNLIVFCTSEAERSEAERDLPEIVRRQPARILVVTPLEDDAPLESFVSAYCHLGGGRQRICSEQVTLRAGRAQLESLPTAARTLLIGDLPTALWWVPPARTPSLEGSLLEELARMAEHLVYDSAGWGDPAAALVSSALGAAPRVRDASPDVWLGLSDLSWRRLEPWRRLIGDSLDPAVAPGALRGIRSVEVEHGPRGAAQGWLLVGWLAHCLGWRPRRASGRGTTRLGFDAPQGPVEGLLREAREAADDEPTLARVRVRWRANDGERERVFERRGRGNLGTGEGAGDVALVGTPPQDRASLVARELAERGGSPLLRESLAVARTLARHLT